MTPFDDVFFFFFHLRSSSLSLFWWWFTPNYYKWSHSLFLSYSFIHNKSCWFSPSHSAPLLMVSMLISVVQLFYAEVEEWENKWLVRERGLLLLPQFRPIPDMFSSQRPMTPSSAQARVSSSFSLFFSLSLMVLSLRYIVVGVRGQ